MWNSLAWLLGLEEFTSIDAVAVTLSAEWASGAGALFWTVLGALVTCTLFVAFYLKWQSGGPRVIRLALGICRGLLLSLLVLTLAEPVLTLNTRQSRPPLV